ncbi:MAG: HDOD domain-containing protein [Chloroflexota bacterium]|jgi:putative nucleotidyltransferase with HDIG domain
MLSQRVNAILQSIKHLRPIPSNVTRILKEMENPHTSLSMVGEYIGLDQALAALVLQMANSVSLGYDRSCTSINDAVVRIGLKRLKSLLLASVAVGPLNQRLSGYRLGAGELWNHSIGTAVAAEWLARALNYEFPEQAYVSGLLHDIGKLLLDQYVLTDYSNITMYVHKYKLPLWQVEEKLIGVDHAKVGGLIAQRWGFPIVLVDAIRCHHYPSLAQSDPVLPAIINLANYLVIQVKGSELGLFCDVIHPDTYTILSIERGHITRFEHRIQDVLGASVF